MYFTAMGDENPGNLDKNQFFQLMMIIAQNESHTKSIFLPTSQLTKCWKQAKCLNIDGTSDS